VESPARTKNDGVRGQCCKGKVGGKAATDEAKADRKRRGDSMTNCSFSTG